jgi:hypothetical protein
MRLIISVIISPFLASSSFRGSVESNLLTPEQTTSTTEETTSTPAETASSSEETSIPVETTSITGETTPTAPGAWYFDDPLIVSLRERARAQISKPSDELNADPLCIAHEDLIPDLLRNVIISIGRMKVRERSQRCPELNLGKFMQAVCPEYWSSRKKQVHSLAVQLALLCSSSLGGTIISVDRSRIIDSTFLHLGSEEADFRKNVKITFEGEDGVDAGGLFKDWVTRFATDLIVKDDYLFKLDAETNQVKITQRELKTIEDVQRLMSIGKFLGIVARRDQATAPISLPLVYYSKLLDKPLMWDSLSEEEKHRTNFHATMRMPSNLWGDEILEVVWTLENRLELVNRAINFLSEDEMVKIGHVKWGLEEVLSEDVMNLLSPQDLQAMIEGDSEIDPADLLHNKELTTSSISHQKKYTDTVTWFERLIGEEMDQEDLKKLVQFVTGLARPPLGGFSKLNPKFTLNIYDGPASKLPTAHTCSNTIDIPLYESEEMFVAKLYLAINSDPGMGSP